MDPLRITAKDAMTLFEDGSAVFVDVRNPQAWGEANAKLPAAIRVALDDIEKLVNRVPRGKDVIAYCT